MLSSQIPIKRFGARAGAAAGLPQTHVVKPLARPPAPLAGATSSAKPPSALVDSHADLGQTERLPPPHSSEWLLLDRIAGDHGRKTLISGYFRSRSRALIIGRFSTGAETRRGQMRAMALAGKLFPAIPVTPGGCAQPISLRWMISAAGPPAKPMMPSSAAAQT